ncbi:MAG: hypothetical protein K0B07_05535 [DPANN group archaeon]|nr:hypothetical protein [DPANN group archaeon]
MVFVFIKKNRFVFCTLFGLLCFFGVANATDLNITTFQNITDNCTYVSGIYTYNCSVDASGNVWDNIYVVNNIELPKDHGTYDADSANIIFQANNEFKSFGSIGASGTIYGCAENGAGGSGGSITIIANNITLTTLSAVGVQCQGFGKCSYCRGGGSGGIITLNGIDIVVSGNLNIYGGGAQGRSGGNGGTLRVIADTFEGQVINAYGSAGSDSGGSGGRIELYAKDINIKTINAYGAVGYNSGGGSGGSLIIESENTTINGNLGFYGNYGDYPGGSGGSIIINTQYLDLNGMVNLNGNYAYDRYGHGGSGGSILVIAYEIKKIGNISASGSYSRVAGHGGSGGVIKLITENDLVLPSITAVGGNGGGGVYRDDIVAGNGGSGGLVLVTADKLNITNPINTNGGSGGGGSYHGGRGGNARSVILYFNDINYSGYLISSRGGAAGRAVSPYLSVYWGAPGNGGNIYLFSDLNTNVSDYVLNVSGGSGSYSGTPGNKAVSKRTVPTGFRLTSNIKELSTNNPFFGSLQIRVINPETGTYVSITKTYNAWFGETIIDNGDVNSLFGSKPLMFMLAKKYYLEVTTSDDLFFSKANCDLGLANCDTHFVEFRQYYE